MIVNLFSGNHDHVRFTTGSLKLFYQVSFDRVFSLLYTPIGSVGKDQQTLPY